MSPSTSLVRVLSLALCTALLAPLAKAQITPGNLVVLRVGDGSATLSSAATAVFYDEYTSSGAFVQTIALPTAVSGSHRRVAVSGSATSEGILTQSVDGRYLISVGYDAALGTASVVSTTSATANRVVARVAIATEAIDSSTALADAYSGNNLRSATSLDGSAFWTAGTSSTSGSVRYAALGAASSTQLATNLTNVRVVNVFDGQLYCSSASGAFLGVSTVGVGTPTTSGQTITLLPGFGAAGTTSYDFFLADANTLYVADDRNSGGNGGIQKWLLIAGTWTYQYTLSTLATVGCRGLSGEVVGGIATLYATTTDNKLVTVTDLGAGSTVTVLVTGATNTALRGVRLVRCPSVNTEFFGSGTPHTSGTPTIGAVAPFTMGASTGVTANGMLANHVAIFLAGIRIPPVDLSTSGAPLGTELHLYLLDYAGLATDPSGAATWSLVVPTSAALCGGELSWQLMQIDFGMSAALPLAVSGGMTTRFGI